MERQGLEPLVAVVERVVQSTKLKAPQRVQNAFALQIALVITGIRGGYLVDGIFLDALISLRLYAALIAALPFAEHQVAFILDEASGNAFFINIKLYCSRMADKDFPYWISTIEPYATVSQPTPVKELFDMLNHSLATSDISEHTITSSNPEAMVPFAAFLLEYPIAYVPHKSLQSDFFARVELDVFQVDLQHSTLGRVPLIQFSCPACLSRGEDLAQAVRTRFELRLGLTETSGIVIVEMVKRTLDRVAL